MTDTAIFDMDGTLVDTVLMTAQALRELTGRHGLQVPPAEAVRDAMGLHDPAFYRALFPDAPREVLTRLSAEVEPREGEIGRQLGRGILFPGVREMLERLRERGVRLCLASTGSRVHVRDMLDCAGIRGFFSDIGCDVPDKRAITGDILRRAGGGRAAFVGDTRLDVEAARVNGLKVFGAGFGYVKPGERALFDAVADTPEALAALLLSD